MKVILHADDFGYDADSTLATIECFRNGVLTSASIMSNMPCAQEAVDFARDNKQFSYGVHLTYVDGITPLSNISLNSIANSKGFYQSNFLRMKAFLRLINLKELIEETKKQIDFVLDNGVKVSHLDSHGHMHKFPIFRDAVQAVSEYYDIDLVRRNQNISLERTNYFLNLINQNIDKALAGKFRSTDYFYMPTNESTADWPDKLITTLNQLKIGSIEIGVHPGYKECWRRSEFDALHELVDKLKLNHEIVSWNAM